MRSILSRAAVGITAAVGILTVGAGSAFAADTYEVQPGDTLSGIAARFEHVPSWQSLDAANDKITNPDLILPGQVIALSSDAAPAAGGSSSTGAAASTSNETDTSESSSSSSASSASQVATSVWDRLAQCESSGDWHINTGNGYYGGLQFAKSSWDWVGGSGYPHEASKQEQIARAEILLERQGWQAWPACSRQLGLR